MIKTMQVPSEMVEHFWRGGTAWGVSTQDGTPDVWTFVTTFDGDKGRWHTWRTMVLEGPDGNFWGVSYGVAATEYQEHDLPWDDRETVDLHRLVPETKTVVTYRPWGDSDD